MFRMPANANPAARGVAVAPPREEARPAKLLECELLDLYGAILIVVPIALLFKSLWS
jgi:hypothetical protein